MKRSRGFGRWMATVACATMILPRATWSAESIRRLVPPNAAAEVIDVHLDPQQRLCGQFVDRQGRPQPNTDVSLWNRDARVACTRTGPNGVFCFEPLQGGLYRIQAANAEGVYRVWTAQSAPPDAQPAVLLVHGIAVRGQQDCFTPAPAPPRHARQAGLYSGHYDGAIIRTLSNPWVVGGVIAAGIAIPLALSDDSEGS